MPELYVNCHIDTDSVSGSEITKWRSSGQFTLDIAARGIRMDLEAAGRFSDPSLAGTPDPFMVKNIDRAAALGLKILCIADPLVLRSAAWDALGGDWDGHVPSSVNWRVNRAPNNAAVMAKIIQRIQVTVAYGLQVLGPDRFQVQIGNETRNVTRTGGDFPGVGGPATSAASGSGVGMLVVNGETVGNNLTPQEGGGSGYYIRVETSPNPTYLILTDWETDTGVTNLFVTNTNGTSVDCSAMTNKTVRFLDHALYDGDTDLEYLDQLSQIIVALRAAFPTVKLWGPSFFQLGGADATGIKTYLDTFADRYINGDLALQPGWLLLDGWTFNAYAFTGYFASVRGKANVGLLAGLIRDNAIQGVNFFRTATAGKSAAWTALGWLTKPLMITEFGWSRTDLDMKSQNIDTGSPTLPPSEFFRGQVTRRTIELLEALSGGVEAVMLFHARSDTATGSVNDDAYGFIDLPGAPTKALQAMARTRDVGSVIPSGYASAGGSFIGASGVSAPF